MELANGQSRLGSYDVCLKPEDRRAATLYDRHARHIDVLFGRLTENSAYRKRAVAALKLANDSTVLDIGCGIGSNFRTIESYLSEKGVLVGVDVSSESLKLARKRILKHKWRNVRLANASIADYRPDIRFDAALCTFALEIMEDYERAIDNVYDLLKPGGSFVMIGMKLTSRLPYGLLNPLVDQIWRRAGVDPTRNVRPYVKCKTWEIELQEECLFGFYYILRARKGMTTDIGRQSGYARAPTSRSSARPVMRVTSNRTA